LGKIHAQQAIEALIAVSMGDSYFTSSAVQALGNFNDEVSAQRLLKMVEEDGPSGGVAAYALAKRNDSRAVRLLVEKLVSGHPADQHTGNIAGRIIADFQGPGLAALEPLATDADLEIRRRAIVGLGDMAFGAKEKSVKAKARQLLRKCLEIEKDPELRRQLEVEIDCRS
jgi:HEAT repeat protein